MLEGADPTDGCRILSLRKFSAFAVNSLLFRELQITAKYRNVTTKTRRVRQLSDWSGIFRDNSEIRDFGHGGESPISGGKRHSFEFSPQTNVRTAKCWLWDASDIVIALGIMAVRY